MIEPVRGKIPNESTPYGPWRCIGTVIVPMFSESRPRGRQTGYTSLPFVHRFRGSCFRRRAAPTDRPAILAKPESLVGSVLAASWNQGQKAPSAHRQNVRTSSELEIRVFVTGAAGFIGSWLVRYLLEQARTWLCSSATGPEAVTEPQISRSTAGRSMVC